MQGNILDLVLTNLNINLNVINVIVHSDPILFPCDHFAITIKLTTVRQPAHKSGSFFSFNYAKGDFEGLCKFLYNYDFMPSFLSHDVN